MSWKSLEKKEYINIYIFTYQKTLLHTLLLLVFKIIESLQFIFKLLCYETDKYCSKKTVPMKLQI